jgi:hypothetical protein
LTNTDFLDYAPPIVVNISASSFLRGGFEPELSINNNYGDAWLSQITDTNLNSGKGEFLMLEHSESYVCSTYRIYPRNALIPLDNYPFDFDLKGSNDGVNFRILNRQEGIQFVANEFKTFNVSNSATIGVLFRFFQLLIRKSATNNSDGSFRLSNHVGVSDFQLQFIQPQFKKILSLTNLSNDADVLVDIPAKYVSDIAYDKGDESIVFTHLYNNV